MTDQPSWPEQLTLVDYPHPALRQQARPVTVFDGALAAFCQRLLAAMYREKGVGLAAPQVAVPWRIFATDHGGREGSPEPQPRVWINPRIIDPCGETIYEEGCLSFPGIYAKVRRHNAFTVVWQDVHGQEQQQRLDVQAGDFLGIVVQHELDHLDGTVFVDHLSPMQVQLVRRKLRDLEATYKAATGRAGAVLRR